MNTLLVVSLAALVALCLGQTYEDNDSSRFGKRSDPSEDTQYQDKRNGAPQPFVRFGRSGHIDRMHDILSTLRRLQAINA